MRFPRKAAVAITTAFFLGAGINAVRVAFADCDVHWAGSCSVSPSAQYWTTWDVESYGVAIEIGSTHMEFRWSHAPTSVTTVVKSTGRH